MPKRREPELDHKPLGWGSRPRNKGDKEVALLVQALKSNRPAIRKAFKACGVALKADDAAALFERLQVILIKFVASCRAHPLRTARQLLPTVEAISTDPEAFLATMDTYSPEAVALVYDMYLRLFPDRRDLQAFETGNGPAPESGDIACAADAAIAILEEEAKAQGRGRPKMELVEDLAVALGKQFIGLGGNLGRTYHRSGHERGAFLDFIEAVVGPARGLVRLSGYSLTPETMVRQAQQAEALKDRADPSRG